MKIGCKFTPFAFPPGEEERKVKVKVKLAQSCPTLCNPMDCTVHRILQVRILEWVAFPSFSRSSQPRDQTQVSCTAGGSLLAGLWEERNQEGKQDFYNSKHSHFIGLCICTWKQCQFSSFGQSCLTLCNPMDCRTPGLPVHHQLLEFTQTQVHWVGEAIIPSSSCPQSFPASGSFQMSQLFASGGQSTGVSASASVFPMNIQDWFCLGWTGWISLQSKGLSRVFLNTTVQKHQFFSTQLSL